SLCSRFGSMNGGLIADNVHVRFSFRRPCDTTDQSRRFQVRVPHSWWSMMVAEPFREVTSQPWWTRTRKEGISFFALPVTTGLGGRGALEWVGLTHTSLFEKIWF